MHKLIATPSKLVRSARSFATLALCSVAFLGSTANATDFIVNTGDGVCPAGARLATMAEIQADAAGACKPLGEWYIARIAGGGSQDGSGYQCRNRTQDSRTLGHSLCVKTTATASTTPVKPTPGTWYKLQTQFQGDGKCLEGNQAASTVKGGAAFMDSCQNVTGQLWSFVPEGEYYRLKTQFQGQGKCLEGNQAASTVKGGAAFMDSCQNVSGQLWKLVPEGQYFRMKTMFQGDGKCLEGNQAASTVKGGAAFMDSCQNVTGQLWKLTPAK